MTDAEIVACLQRQYDGDTFDHTEETAGIYWSLLRGDGTSDNPDLIMCRGSTTPEDWIRDFESELGRSLPQWTQLGLLPDGFSRGLAQAWGAITDTLDAGRRTLTVAGHSLGAAHAAELAAMLNASDIVQHVVLCGCPRPGTSALASLFDPKIIASYRNGNDPVCDVPVTLGPWLPWCPIAPYIAINDPSAPDDEWGPLAEHHLFHYLAGITKLGR